MLMSLQKLSGVCVFMSQCKDIDLNILELTKKEKGTCKLDKKRCQYLLPKQFKTRVKLVAESDLPNACFV